MPRHFSTHYTVEEATALLPQIREWLARLEALQNRIAAIHGRLEDLQASGDDLGGADVNDWIRANALAGIVRAEFESREIQLKDVDRGLLDFPSLREGREVFLCWEKEEEDITHWHDLDSGYAGRERIS